MTSEEKQEIINAVLSALATNSKTIAQLSPVTALTDEDSFEINAGRRVTYLVLKNGIREGLVLASQLSNYITGEQAIMYLAKLNTETGTIDFKESPCVMLDGFKDVNGYSPATGDLFYENRSGYQIWIKNQGGAKGYHANTHVAYINRNENAIYRWTGTTMELIGSAPVNNLTTGGEDKALSAEMGKRLKAKVDEVQANIVKLYSKLANMAFWDAEDKANAEPTPLDWGNPKHNVTLALSLTNAVVKHNGVAKANGDSIQVEEGGTLSLIVEPASGYALTSVTSSTTGATVTDLGNGTYSVELAMGHSDMTLSITGSTTKQPTYAFFPRKSAQINNGVVVAPETTTGRNRATILVPNEDVVTPTVWGSHDSTVQTAIQAAYSLIPIPSGATAFKYKMNNATFKIVIGLASNTIGNGSSSVLYDSTWLDAQAAERTIDLTQYPTATQMSINLKHADDSTPFELTDTLDSIGLGSEYFSFRFE